LDALKNNLFSRRPARFALLAWRAWHTQTMGRRYIIFAWAIRLRLKAATGKALPRQKHHALQAKAMVVSRSD
jgi:hypothetical protein